MLCLLILPLRFVIMRLGHLILFKRYTALFGMLGDRHG